MKKSTIWILTIVMALTFAGLLYMQFMYMEQMIDMRAQHFREGAKRSLYSLTTALEQNETKKYLEEDMMIIEQSIFDPAPGSVNMSTQEIQPFTLKSNKGNDLSDKITDYQESLKEQYLYQKGLLNEVIINILNQSSNRPITERADSAIVKSYLKTELENNGISIPFEYGIVDRKGHVVFKTEGFDENAPEREIVTQTLFPNDPEVRRHNIRVYFPDLGKMLFSSIKFMIPAFVFTLILLIIFVLTIILAFRQKKLSEMKNDFINNMTHEFKTPISTISLAAQMLSDDSVRKSPTMLQHVSTVINDETKRLRFQVEKVLQMSMFDRQKATLKLQDIDANAAIENIVNTFKIKVEKYGGKIDSRLDAEDPIVNVDEMHFTNVIFNLLDNAVKYRKDEVPLELTVTTKNINDKKIEITIQDNGIGMKEEDVKKIFEKFYRVSTGNRHDVKGFGLGLAYVQKMVTELKGHIRAESKLGKGSKFIITLPIIND